MGPLSLMRFTVSAGAALLPAAVVVRGAVVTVAEDAAVCAETWMAERSVMVAHGPA